MALPVRVAWGCVPALALAACGGSPAQPDRVAAPPKVRIAQVGGAGEGTRAIAGVGSVALRSEAQLGFTSTGRILRVAVNEGDAVHRGQLLAALDTTSVAADLAQVDAERTRAAAEYRRSATLLKQGWVTAPRVESARAALLAAEAQARSARFRRDTAAIVAPGPGVVLARLAEPGQVVTAGAPVLVIGEQASGYVLRLPLSDRDAAHVAVGAAAQVTFAALDGATLAGRVIEVAGRADRATGTFAVEIALPADPRLRSGQIGNVRIAGRPVSSGDTGASLAVPASAVFAARAGEGFVYVVDPASRRVAQRRVTLGETGDDALRVTAGLSPGEWVAASRIDRLRPGMTITPIRMR